MNLLPLFLPLVLLQACHQGDNASDAVEVGYKSSAIHVNIGQENQKSPDSVIGSINALVDSTLNQYRGNWRPHACGFDNYQGGFLSYKDIRERVTSFKVDSISSKNYSYHETLIDSLLIQNWIFKNKEEKIKSIEISQRLFQFPNGTLSDTSYSMKIIQLRYIRNIKPDTIFCQFRDSFLQAMRIGRKEYWYRCYVWDFNIDRAFSRFGSIYNLQKDVRF